MKTFGRILIILTAFAIVMGAAYMAVNGNSTSSTNAPTIENRDGFMPDGIRPEFQEGGSGGFSWLFDMVKNIGIVAVIVAMITMPKNLMQRSRQPVSVQH